jgi:hypothetical protein
MGIHAYDRTDHGFSASPNNSTETKNRQPLIADGVMDNYASVCSATLARLGLQHFHHIKKHGMTITIAAADKDTIV